MIQGADMMARVRTVCGALLLMWAGLSLPVAVSAEDGACGVERDARQGTLDELTWRQLNTIYEQVGEEAYGEASDDLSRMLERAGRDRYLRAILNQALGQVEWARGNYESALGHYQQAVELDILPDETHFALMYQIAQLYYRRPAARTMPPRSRLSIRQSQWTTTRRKTGICSSWPRITNWSSTPRPAQPCRR
jgi:hypothetical protein